MKYKKIDIIARMNKVHGCPLLAQGAQGPMRKWDPMHYRDDMVDLMQLGKIDVRHPKRHKNAKWVAECVLDTKDADRLGRLSLAGIQPIGFAHPIIEMAVFAAGMASVGIKTEDIIEYFRREHPEYSAVEEVQYKEEGPV